MNYNKFQILEFKLEKIWSSVITFLIGILCFLLLMLILMLLLFGKKFYKNKDFIYILKITFGIILILLYFYGIEKD